jgi:hypothetical protein
MALLSSSVSDELELGDFDNFSDGDIDEDDSNFF